MTIAAYTRPSVEVTTLLGEIELLRSLYSAPNAGHDNRVFLLSCTQLIHEKTERLEQLGWIK